VVGPFRPADLDGAQLAEDMLEGDRVKDGSILLVSDLETTPDDVPDTARVLRSIKRAGTPVRLLALGLERRPCPLRRRPREVRSPRSPTARSENRSCRRGTTAAA
jgi:hypothetical protein